MSGFSIYDVKAVEEFYDPDEVNRRLQSGWVLLSVGFNTEGEETYKVYILGKTNQEENVSGKEPSRLSQLRNK